MNYRISTNLLRIYTNSETAGYTLIELMVVMTVIAIIATIAFFGLKSVNNTQPVDNAVQEFVVNLHAVQNRVDNGEILTGGSAGKVVQEVLIPHSGSSYSINGTVVDLSKLGVTISNNDPTSAITVCFPDRNLPSYDNTTKVGSVAVHVCGSCISGSGFYCRNGVALDSPPITVTFTKGAYSKSVLIDGSGMRVTEVDKL